MMTTARRVGLVGAMMMALVTGAAGCNALRAGGARHKYINDQTQTFVYKMPITQVWPNVRTTLFEAGYETKSSDTGGSYSLETEPKTDAGETTRYLAQGVKVDDNSCTVQITRATFSPTRKHSERDLEMEWTLLQKVDPQAAAQIKGSADAAGEAAKKP